MYGAGGDRGGDRGGKTRLAIHQIGSGRKERGAAGGVTKGEREGYAGKEGVGREGAVSVRDFLKSIINK